MKKKGFTLIELLAVLVVLAILALITIPLVIGIIKNAREKSNERSIEAYGRAVENAVGVYLLNNPNEQPTTISLTSLDIQTSGQTVKCDDNVIINTNGSIRLENCYVGDSNQKYNYDNKKLEKISSDTSSTTYKAYSVGDEIRVANNSYYVIADSGINQDYVVAIGSPIYRDTYSLFSSTDFATQIANDNSENTHMYLYSAYLYSDTCKYEGDISGCSSDYDNSSIKQVVNIWAENTFTDELKTVDGYKARLIKIEELEELGYVKEEDYYPLNENVPNWLSGMYSYYFWTMSPYVNSNNEISSSSIFMVNRYQSGSGVENAYAYSAFCVRPVINVYKDKLPE